MPSKCTAARFLILLALVARIPLAEQRQSDLKNKWITSTNKKLSAISSCANDVDSLFKDFSNILIPRVPGTDGQETVKLYLLNRLSQLDTKHWEIREHTFTDTTPLGEKPFSNIIATLDPHIDKRVVLCAHWDSKIISGGEFLGATDSALSVALLLDLALSIDSKLPERRNQDFSLQLIFFDGEEAFRSWTATDSLYGSRKLAAEMSMSGGLLSVGDKTGIEAMDVFILLDLIGSISPYPQFLDTMQSGSEVFQRLANVEKRLAAAGLLEAHQEKYKNYFVNGYSSYKIGDDHQPFLDKGVPIVHLITIPFPNVWHTLADNAKAIDKTMVRNFKKILTVFLYESLRL